jgi:hypothetical protein
LADRYPYEVPEDSTRDGNKDNRRKKREREMPYIAVHSSIIAQAVNTVDYPHL